MSFTNPSNTYDGADRDARGDHDLWFVGYGSSVVGSPVARMKLVLGELLNLSTVGDDAWITYGRAMSVIMHAALAGDGLDQVPFLLNSPKDTALARILEEAVLAVNEDAHDLSMPEWAKHCAELLASKSLGDRAKTALTLGVNDFFHHETWAPYLPPAGSGPGGGRFAGHGVSARAGIADAAAAGVVRRFRVRERLQPSCRGAPVRIYRRPHHQNPMDRNGSGRRGAV